MFKLLRMLVRNELDLLLRRLAAEGKKSLLIPWNRGLGDIALGLYTYTCRIRMFIPDARITFITREDLVEGFKLLEGVEVIGVPWWTRGKSIDLDETLLRLGMQAGSFDAVMDNANPTKWLSWQIGKVVPKLKWDDQYDELSERFNLDIGKAYIGVHVSSETAQFYKYQKDWPIDSWKKLFEKINREKNKKVLLFGHKKSNEFDCDGVVDMRGNTGLIEMVSIIKNRCSTLIAPDGGVLSIVYYVDADFPLKVISLWGDANQGVLKQRVGSPNKELKHTPIIGSKGHISNISIEKVLAEI